MRQLFITGTDTDCGKTYVTCKLLKNFKDNGYKIHGLKPVASGGLQDILAISACNANDLPVCYVNYAQPIAPHLAAENMGHTLRIDDIVTFCNNPQYLAMDYVIIEGAGGLLVPLNTTETWIDFIQQANISVLLVVGIRLGCINHALLTSYVLQAHKIHCIGWVANCIQSDMAGLQENITSLMARLPYPHLATIAHA